MEIRSVLVHFDPFDGRPVQGSSALPRRTPLKTSFCGLAAPVSPSGGPGPGTLAAGCGETAPSSEGGPRSVSGILPARLASSHLLLAKARGMFEKRPASTHNWAQFNGFFFFFFFPPPG